MKILLVEDDDAIAIYVRRLMEPHSDIVHAVKSLEQCTTLLEHDRYDVIILDLKLTDAAPSLTVSAIPKIRALQPDAAIIVQTGLGENHRESSLAAGADYFMAKTPEQLERRAFCAAILAALQTKSDGKRLAANMEMLRKISEL